MLWPTNRSEQYYPSLLNSGDLHRSLDDLLDDFFGGASTKSQQPLGLSPRFEVSETEDAVLIEAELPGMDEKDIELTVHDHVLTLKGEKKRDQKVEKKNYYIKERSFGHFQRSLQLGSNVNVDKIEASFKKGVLTITVPVLEPEKKKARSIDIKSK